MQNNFTQRAVRNLARYATILLFLCSLKGFSQTLRYPSSTGGNWASTGAWSTTCGGAGGSTYPNSTAFNVTMSCAETITATGTVNPMACNNLTISGSTAVLNVSSTLTVTNLTMSAGTLNITGNLFVTGTVSITGGSITGSGNIVLGGAAQSISSSIAIPNLNVTGTGTKTMGSNLTVSSRLTLTAATLAVGGNTLTVGSSSGGNDIEVSNGRILTTSSSSLSFGGSVEKTLGAILSNTWPVTLNNFSTTRSLTEISLGTNQNLMVNGTFNLAAGKFSIGSSTLTLNGPITGGGVTGGQVIGGANANLTIGGSGVASMYFDLSSFQTIGGSNTIRNLTINRTSNPLIMLSSMRVGNTLTTAANAALQISNGSTQTLSIDGTVAGTGRLIGGSAAILHINGSNALGGGLVFASSPQLASFTMNRIGGTANFASAFSVGGMSLNSGVVNNSAGITVTGNAPNNVQQSVSSSYINGPLARTIAANSNGATYIWPIGASASQKLTLNGLTTASSGNVIITAQAFDGDAGGTTDGTLSDANTDHYWSANATSNAANLVSVGTISLNDNGLSATDAIGYSPTLGGQFTSLGGTVASGAVTSVTESPVAMGFYKIGTGQSVCTDPTLATINASSTTNCGTQPTTLSIATGDLNSATAWTWYSGSCGGTLVGTGASINVSPATTTTYYVRGEGGCITAGDCASVTITVNTPQIWYADADGDTFGNPNVSQLACEQPLNYVLNNTDCNDANNQIHTTFAFYTDGDGDGFGTGSLVQVCAIDSETPPTGYSLSNTDCDDNNNQIHTAFEFYVDNDNDGYGVGNPVSICAIDANTPPTGYALNNTDCDDLNPLLYQSADLYIDADFDGYTSGETQTVCYGATIPSGYLLNLTAIDCNDNVGAIHPNAADVPYNGIDDNCDGVADETGTVFTTLLASSCGVTLNALQSLIGIQTVGGHQITGYRIRATGGGQTQTIETTVPHFTMTQFANYAYATTYSIDVQLQRAGLWQASWGAVCFVSTPAILQQGGSAAVNPLQCGITLSQINSLIATSSIAGVTGYRFRVTNLTDPTGPNAVQTVDRVQNWFTLQMLTRYNYGTQYRIEVSVKTTGSYGGYGTPCEITSPPVPSMVNCGSTVAAMTTPVAVTSTSGAAQYRFQIVRASDNASATIDRSTNFFTFNLVPSAIFTPGAEYFVRVSIMTTGNWSPFSDVCELTAPGGVSRPVENAVVASVKASAYPNPFTHDFSVAVENPVRATLKVYDMLGKLVESMVVDAADVQDVKLGGQYPSGVYNVIVEQGGGIRTMRVVKR